MQTRTTINGVQHLTPAGRIWAALNMFALTDGRTGAGATIGDNIAFTHLEIAYATLRGRI